MTDAQTWTVIAALLAILVALEASVLAVVRAEIAILREHIDGIRDLQRLYAHALDHEATPT